MLTGVSVTFDLYPGSATPLHRGDAASPLRSRRPNGTAIIEPVGTIAAMRQRVCIAPGGLAERSPSEGTRLVSAADRVGHTWWISASTVWADWATSEAPQHPRPVGLASASTSEQTLVAGLSDRLGWEAMKAFERGADLPTIDDLPDTVDTSRLIVLDGRLGHDVPTVLLLGRQLLRWGSGATWADAVQRALYGQVRGVDHAVEAAIFEQRLTSAGLSPVVVDVGSATLAGCGLVRWSVQLALTATS